jgi:hypothetical protein
MNRRSINAWTGVLCLDGTHQELRYRDYLVPRVLALKIGRGKGTGHVLRREGQDEKRKSSPHLSIDVSINAPLASSGAVYRCTKYLNGIR